MREQKYVIALSFICAIIRKIVLQFIANYFLYYFCVNKCTTKYFSLEKYNLPLTGANLTPKLSNFKHEFIQNYFLPNEKIVASYFKNNR